MTKKPSEEAIFLAIDEIASCGGIVFKCPCCEDSIASIVVANLISPELLRFMDENSTFIRPYVPHFEDLPERVKARARAMLAEMDRQKGQ